MGDSPACAFYKHAGSKQCESALNDWCVQNSPYKYARFDVGQNQQSTNRWRCYSSGALTDDPYSVDFDAMELYPENRCPSIANEPSQEFRSLQKLHALATGPRT